MEVTLDPQDQLPAMIVGDWAAKKHKLLRHYVDISHGPRRGWVDANEAARRKLAGPPAGASYIELFCGPGRLCLEQSGNFVDGSPLVSHGEAQRTRTGFTSFHLGDERPDFCDAVATRLRKRGAQDVKTYPMAASQAAARIVENLNPHGLNFAFLDPFGFEELPFSIIETLGCFKRMDVLIYVSAMGLQKNLPQWIKSEKCALDDFAPGWRKAVPGRNGDDIVSRGLVFEHWLSLIRDVGFQDPSGKPPLIRGPQNQALYWLVLVAKHELATRFWEAVSRDETQDDIFSMPAR